MVGYWITVDLSGSSLAAMVNPRGSSPARMQEVRAARAREVDQAALARWTLLWQFCIYLDIVLGGCCIIVAVAHVRPEGLANTRLPPPQKKSLSGHAWPLPSAKMVLEKVNDNTAAAVAVPAAVVVPPPPRRHKATPWNRQATPPRRHKATPWNHTR